MTLGHAQIITPQPHKHIVINQIFMHNKFKYIIGKCVSPTVKHSQQKPHNLLL